MNLDKYKGAMFGMACGDSLGTTVEFKARGTFTPMTTIVGGGCFKLKAGEWTDDTSMGLCLAESLVKHKQWVPEDVMDLYVKWWAHGHNSSNGDCFDIGNTVRAALKVWKARKQWEKEDADPYCGEQGTDTAGNGCIMRLAPVPLFFAKSSDAAIVKYCELSSATTHGAPQCIQLTAFFGLLITKILKGDNKEKAFRESSRYILDHYDRLHHEAKLVIEGSFLRKTEDSIVGNGYVVNCLEAALWAFYNSNDFKTGALMAVNLGADADTTGAVYGQIAGAFYGYEGIPEEWRKVIARKDLITKLSKELYQASNVQ